MWVPECSACARPGEFGRVSFVERTPLTEQATHTWLVLGSGQGHRADHRTGRCRVAGLPGLANGKGTQMICWRLSGEVTTKCTICALATKHDMANENSRLNFRSNRLFLLCFLVGADGVEPPTFAL